MTATYAVRDVGSTTTPRGYVASGTRASSALVRVSMTLTSYEHQLLTSSLVPSGETVSAFGTSPTGMTASTASDFTSMR